MNQSHLVPVKFTAVIPAYNREATISACLDSALAQEYSASEILVIDDGSEDGTVKVVERYGPRVKCIRQANAGASAARNVGVDLACHEWVAFLDSDDLWDPGHLARMARAITATEGSAALYFADTLNPEPDQSASLWTLSDFEIESAFELCEDSRDWAMLPLQPMMLQSSVVSRDRFLELGGLWRELELRHDTHFFFVVCASGPVCAVDGAGASMTPDAGENRLTTVFSTETMSYWEETVSLYTALVNGAQYLDHQEREFKNRLLTAHLRLVRFSMRRFQGFNMAKHLAHALALGPIRVASRLYRKLTRALRGSPAAA